MWYNLCKLIYFNCTFLHKKMAFPIGSVQKSSARGWKMPHVPLANATCGNCQRHVRCLFAHQERGSFRG